MVTVPFPEPGYYSYLDEENFFEWLSRIPVVSGIHGGKELTLDLKTHEIDDQSAHEFAAMAVRYDIDARLPASMRKGKIVSLEENVDPEAAVLADKPPNGFSLSFRPVFLSPLDQRGLDDWLKECYPHYAGMNSDKTAVLNLEGDEVTVMNVGDLISLFYRYRLPLRKLRRLCEIADYDYFYDKEAHWYEEIFGP